MLREGFNLESRFLTGSPSQPKKSLSQKKKKKQKWLSIWSIQIEIFLSKICKISNRLRNGCARAESIKQ
jgi:hypothetical protein